MRNFILIFLFFPVFVLAKGNDNGINGIDPGIDSSRISHILNVEYNNDTLSIKALHFSICCEKFVVYDDINLEGKKTFVNLVYQNYERDCLCMCERIIVHKVYIKDFHKVYFKFDGLDPELGIKEFRNPNVPLSKKELRKAKKKK